LVLNFFCSRFLQGGKCVVQSTSLIQRTLREGTALPLPTHPSTNYARTLKKIVLIIQLVIKMRSPPTHQTGKHLKTSLPDKYIHDANRYIQNDLINQTACYTPRNDSVTVCTLQHLSQFWCLLWRILHVLPPICEIYSICKCV
jgi:hypothetical protein